MFAQLAMGAAAGLFLGMLIETGVLGLGKGPTWAMQGIAGFVAGFSEAYFVGVLGRVGNSRPAGKSLDTS